MTHPDTLEQSTVRVHPLTAARWPDLEALFGQRGACGGCWCMYWRLEHATFMAGRGEAHRRAFRRRVRRGPPPGVLAYRNGEVVGWCALEPRTHLPRLARSRVLAPLDDAPVWSVSCFYVRPSARKQGISVALLEGALRWAWRQGATLIEGYPHDLGRQRQAAAFVWTGLAGTFRHAGFTEVARRSPTRPMMRRACPTPVR